MLVLYHKQEAIHKLIITYSYTHMAHPPLHIVRMGEDAHHYSHPPVAIPNSLSIAPFAGGNGRMSVVVRTFCRRRAQEVQHTVRQHAERRRRCTLAIPQMYPGDLA